MPNLKPFGNFMCKWWTRSGKIFPCFHHIVAALITVNCCVDVHNQSILYIYFQYTIWKIQKKKKNQTEFKLWPKIHSSLNINLLEIFYQLFTILFVSISVCFLSFLHLFYMFVFSFDFFFHMLALTQKYNRTIHD